MSNIFVTYKLKANVIWVVGYATNQKVHVKRLGDKITRDVEYHEFINDYNLIKGKKINSELNRILDKEQGLVLPYIYILHSSLDDEGIWYAVEKVSIHSYDLKSEFIRFDKTRKLI
ncbi:hypothetical protein [Halobacteriovorax sp.]|uniref:hypothetical protein n=1 Tax=Halobacteriovorax sp. TaxID=2020862 RepID=UPI003AF2415E